MKAIVYHAPFAVSYDQVPDPLLEDAQDAIVRVEMTALCGSDLHVYEGRETGLDPYTPLGHEFVGEIVDVGGSVRHFAPGDKVVSPFSTSCGTCFFCRQNLTGRCSRGQLYGWVAGGQGLGGAQAEYVRVPLADATLMHAPEGMEPEQSILLADILPTGYFVADNARIEAGDCCAVVGCGPVGLMAIACARELGADRVFAIDGIAERLALAERLGGVPLNFATTDVAASIAEATDGRGVDKVLEVVGSAEATRTAMRILRIGGTMSVVGVHNEAHFAFSPNEAYDKNLTFRIGRCSARAYMASALSILRSGKYPLARVISHRLQLQEGKRAYKMFADRAERCTKIVFTPGAN